MTHNYKNNLTNNRVYWVIIPALAYLIVTVCSLFFRDFFFIDDAQNEMLPFMKEMGGMWWRGELPILTARTMLGGNILVDMVLSPFSPQIILVSLVAAKTTSFLIPAKLLAWINITLIMWGTFWAAKTMRIRSSYGLLAAFSVATNPVFLYVYQASWWNFASAFAWFVIAFAAVLALHTHRSRKNFLLLSLSGIFLFASAGTQMQVSFLIILGVFFVYDWFHQKKAEAVDYVWVGLIIALVAIVPLFSEFFLSGDLIERSSLWDNSNNFQRVTLEQLLSTVNPLFSGYMSFYGGYRFLSIPIAYTSILVFLPLFFMDWRSIKLPDSLLWKAICVVMILLLFTSSQTGPLRYPFRYLPIFSLAVILLAINAIDKGSWSLSRQRVTYFIAYSGFLLWLQLFTSEHLVFEAYQLRWFAVSLMLFLMVMTLTIYKKWSVFALGSMVFISWVMMIGKTHTLASKYVAYDESIRHDITMGWQQPKDVSRVLKIGDLPVNSGKSLLINDSLVNGYSPVGQKAFTKLFPYVSTQGWFTIGALNGLLNDNDLWKKLGIGHIYIKDELLSKEINLRPKINQHNLVISQLPRNGLLEIHPQVVPNVNGSLGFQTPEEVGVQFINQNGMRHETYQVQAKPEVRSLIFSRVFWHGYRARLNALELPVGSYQGAFVMIDIPADTGGVLSLDYEPVSWRWSKWSLILGLIIFGFTSWSHKKRSE